MVSEQLAYMPVPVRHLAAMTTKLAQLMSDDDDGTASVTAAEPPKPPPELDEQLVRRIYDESEPTHQQLLKHLAAHPDTWISYPDLSALMGYSSPRQLPGTLGAFGRRANFRYGGRWPFEVEQLAGVWHARMGATEAAIINVL